MEIHLSDLKNFHEVKKFDACIVKSLGIGKFFFYDLKNPSFYHEITSNEKSLESENNLIPVNVQNPDSPVYFFFMKRNENFTYGYYEGNEHSQNIIHNLGKDPSFIMIKPVTYRSDVITWFNGLWYDNYMILNGFDTMRQSNSIWRESFPNKISFLIGRNDLVNKNNEKYLYLVFADGKHFSCKKYVGNGKNTILEKENWKLALIRNISSVANWILIVNDDNRNNLFRFNLPNPYSGIKNSTFEKSRDTLIIKSDAHSLNKENHQYYCFMFS
jgi:hypothetical protein